MLVCVFFIANLHARPRVQRAPGLPCALCHQRATTKHNSGARRVAGSRSRINNYLPSSHARSAWRGRDERSSLLGVGGGGSFSELDRDLTRRHPHPQPLPTASREEGSRGPLHPFVVARIKSGLDERRTSRSPHFIRRPATKTSAADHRSRLCRGHPKSQKVQ
jgi:hypothetical protein